MKIEELNCKISIFMQKLLLAQEEEIIEYPITSLVQLWGEKNDNGDGTLGYCVEVQIRKTKDEYYDSDVESFGAYDDIELLNQKHSIIEYLRYRKKFIINDKISIYYVGIFNILQYKEEIDDYYLLNLGENHKDSLCVYVEKNEDTKKYCDNLSIGAKVFVTGYLKEENQNVMAYIIVNNVCEIKEEKYEI